MPTKARSPQPLVQTIFSCARRLRLATWQLHPSVASEMDQQDVPSTDTIASTATTVPESGPPPPKALEKAIGARIDFLGYGTGAATQQWNKDQENAKKDAAAGNSITVQVKRSK